MLAWPLLLLLLLCCFVLLLVLRYRFWTHEISSSSWANASSMGCVFPLVRPWSVEIGVLHAPRRSEASDLVGKGSRVRRSGKPVTGLFYALVLIPCLCRSLSCTDLRVGNPSSFRCRLMGGSQASRSWTERSFFAWTWRCKSI